MESKVKKKVKEFLENWKLKDFKEMYKNSQITWKKNHPEKVLKSMFPDKIATYSLGEVKKLTPAHFTVKITVGIKSSLLKIENKKHLVAHLVCEIAPFKPSIKGKWGVNPSSVTKNLY